MTIRKASADESQPGRPWGCSGCLTFARQLMLDPDRRIMSPARQRQALGRLTCADTYSRDHGCTHSGTYLA